MTVRSSQQPPMRSSHSPHLISSQINRSVSRGIGQITRPASRGNQASNLQKQSPIFVSGEKWQRWVELAVRVSNLPPNITTWDLFKRFGVEGTIIFIEIYENRQGMREGIARIRFSPPPRRAFWAEDNITMTTSDGQGHFQVKAMLEPPRRSFKVPSPVRKSVTYDEVMSLRPSAIGFGFMHEELTMMSMHEVSPISRHDMKFTVDLLRSRIVVRFQVQLTDSTTVFSGIATDLWGAGRKDRVDSCMFTVPFARLQKVQRVEVDKDRWALIISLESPPEFFWKRPKIELSHSDGLVWSEFDTWARLTDVVYDPQALQGMVVALQNERAVIDIGNTFPPTSTMKELTSIGRWTTYRIIFNKGQDEPTVINDIQNALQDFNIEVVHLDQFQAISAPLATTSASVWSLLDRGGANREQTEKGMVLGNRQTHRVLPFGVRYQLEVCVSQGIIDEHNIKPEFVAALVDLASQDAAKARHILEFAAEQERRIFEPMKIFSDKEALAYSPNSKIPPYCAYMRKATVTPTTIYYSTPTVETSNRVIREYAKYGDRFLRVQFTDEKSEVNTVQI
jgi:RNA-dependent RNA polymerase